MSAADPPADPDPTDAAVAAQYEAYPYPERDPADEAKRLVRGSPSDPAEVDHFLFGGARDWSRPFRALAAGGGTGDGTIQLAQGLADAGCPAEVVWLDRSRAARKVAEARAAARGLTDVRFVSGDLRDAAALGPFDYVDCCGVLHHLPDPAAGLAALAAALAPGGGIGAMVYAPLGRTGVYPMQAALAALTAGLDPAAKVARARAVLAALPETNWLTRNPHLSDHRTSDAGLYDLLLHDRDRPFGADEVMQTVAAAGLDFVSFVAPARYDPATWIGALAEPAAALPAPARAALAERLAGGVRTHVFYAGRGARRPATATPSARPRLRGVGAGQLAAETAAGKAATVRLDGAAHRLTFPRTAAPLLRLLDGRRTLGEAAAALRLDWLAFHALFAPVERRLTGLGLLLYSEGMP
jgi:SAM-dependent methyltransferase